ncbi:unnamed protein product, partial [Amoebophrya sp. A120]
FHNDLQFFILIEGPQVSEFCCLLKKVVTTRETQTHQFTTEEGAAVAWHQSRVRTEGQID